MASARRDRDVHASVADTLVDVARRHRIVEASLLHAGDSKQRRIEDQGQ